MPSVQTVLLTNPPLPTQFRAWSPEGVPTYEGRIAHLVSDQQVRFSSLEELRAFMIRVLTDGQQGSDTEEVHTPQKFLMLYPRSPPLTASLQRRWG
jgi:hypothetical protein